MRSAETIAEHYRRTFARHGRTLAGVDWPKEEDALFRYERLLRAMEGRGIESLLDVGCGCGFFFDFLKRHPARLPIRDYRGVDVLPEMVHAAREMFPDGEFEVADLGLDLEGIPQMDFVVANGVFTVKGSATDLEMESFVDRGIDALWNHANVGIAFNLMTALVDYRHDWLYYVHPAEVITRYTERLGRRFAVFSDSRLFDILYVWVKKL